jgi:hypothetical protein
MSFLLTGWPDWAFFCQLGYFWKLIVSSWNDEVTQRNGDILGYFLIKQIFYILTLICSLKRYWYLRFQKLQGVYVLDFFGYFSKNWVIFSNLMITLSVKENKHEEIDKPVTFCFTLHAV